MKRIAYIVALFLFGSLCNGSAGAAVNIFLKFDGIDGESTSKGHEKWIDVQSFSWGVSSDLTALNPAPDPEKLHFVDFNFTKSVDLSSPKLFQKLTKGEQIDSAVIDFVKPAQDSTGQPYLSYVFSDVLISGLHTSGSSDSGPLESVSFNYQKITVSYSATDEKGRLLPPVTASWDLFHSSTAPVPEPATWILLAPALVLIGARRVLGKR